MLFFLNCLRTFLLIKPNKTRQKQYILMGVHYKNEIRMCGIVYYECQKEI